MALASRDIEFYRENGYLAPLPALTVAEAGVARLQLETLMRATDGLRDPAARHKPHLLTKWVSDLVRHPGILDAVESLLGPNLLVWRAVFFVKPGHTPDFVAWHQDSAYWRLEPDDVLTAWVALTPSTAENGCLRVAPGSHLHPAVPHSVRFSEHNLLVRGQAAAESVPDESARNLELAAGEMSLHHVRMLHGSGPNATGETRVGLAIRYIATRVRWSGRRQSASLVRGVDAFGHFDLEPEPRFDRDPAALSWHRRSRRRYAAELLAETLRHPTRATLRSAMRLLARPGRLVRAIRSVWK